MTMKPDTATTPLSRLERTLLDEFIRARGYDPNDLSTVPDDQREQLLRDASTFASCRLMAVEARSHFLDEVKNGVE